MSISVLGPTFEDLAVNVKKNISNISYIFVGRSAGYIGGSLLGGILFDCMNPHLLLGNPSSACYTEAAHGAGVGQSQFKTLPALFLFQRCCQIFRWCNKRKLRWGIYEQGGVLTLCFFLSLQGFLCWSQRLECVPSLSVSRPWSSPGSCPALGCPWVCWIQVRQHFIREQIVQGSLTRCAN